MTQEQQKEIKDFLENKIVYLYPSDIPTPTNLKDIKEDNGNFYLKKGNKEYIGILYTLDNEKDKMTSIKNHINNFLNRHKDNIVKCGFMWQGCSPEHYTDSLFSIWGEYKTEL